MSIDGPSPTPNDEKFPLQWNLPAVGVPSAWAATGDMGTTAVRVCIVDTGVDTTHPDLRANLDLNKAEASAPGADPGLGYTNGADDDGNGIVDDVYGAAFVNGGKSGNVADENGHGTFVAGVVGAVGNNGIGVAGIAQVAAMVPCKFMDAQGNGWVSDAIKCWEYCLSRDTAIISNSWGGVDNSAALQAAVKHAGDRGVLLVTSAGNGGMDTDVVDHFPSSLPDATIVAVAASTRDGGLWPKSNYGATSVDLAAPGERVLSTGLAGSYVTLSGTSMATPHVSGAARSSSKPSRPPGGTRPSPPAPPASPCASRTC